MEKPIDELLKFALDNGMLDISYVQNEMKKYKRQQILLQHPFSIWEKGEYCYTYLPDDTKKNHRRQIKKKCVDGVSARERIEDEIINYYENTQEEIKRAKARETTLEKMFAKWLEYKTIHTNSSSYIKRIAVDWRKYYANDDIAKMSVTEMTTLYLDNWVHSAIKKYSLTKKQYYNMTIILKQGLDHCVTLGVIQSNPFADVQVNTKMFTRVKKPDDKTQVFMTNEEPLIIEHEYKEFKENGVTAHLGIILLFKLGLRIGELAALRVSDFDDDFSYLHVGSQEIADYEMAENFKFIRTGYSIVDYTKTADGVRDVYVPQEARDIIKTIIRENKKNGYWDKEFLFLRDGERAPSHVFENCLKKACRHELNMTKSPHKARKTYISSLIDAGLNINQVRKMVGHADEKTTLGNYCFNRLTEKETENCIEKALAVK